jgi:hypothetical protein
MGEEVDLDLFGRPVERAKKVKRLLPVAGWVWCDHHGTLHEDMTDPYGSHSRCRKLDHRAVYGFRRSTDGDREVL